MRLSLRRTGAEELPYWDGEPLEPENLEAVKQISELTRALRKDTVLWTGYCMEDLDSKQMDALRCVDWVVDGPFIEELKDLSLKWRGSSNQSIWQKMELGFFIDVTENFDRK